MQSYVEIGSAETLSASLAEILNNDKSVMSCHSGTVFPTTNLQVGMLCFRTDTNILYQLKNATPTWIQLLNLSGASAVVATATSATNIAGGAAGGICWQSAAGTTGFTAAGTSTQVLISNGTTAPTWVAQSTLSVGTAATCSGNAASATNSTQLGGIAAALYAQLASPGFSGTPSAPTAALNTNTTQLATTAFVLASIPAPFPTGTRMSFQQTAAPTGWTKDTTAAINDSIIRLATGTVVSGGSLAFSTWAAQTSDGAVTLSTAQIPSHTHSDYYESGNANLVYSHVAVGNKGAHSNFVTATTGANTNTGAQGGGGSHAHSLSQALKFYDFIIASKN